jgi:hypothetical protein
VPGAATGPPPPSFDAVGLVETPAEQNAKQVFAYGGRPGARLREATPERPKRGPWGSQDEPTKETATGADVTAVR